MHTFQFCRYLRMAPGEHTYLPKKAEIFPVNRMFLYFKNKARGDLQGKGYKRAILLK